MDNTWKFKLLYSFPEEDNENKFDSIETYKSDESKTSDHYRVVGAKETNDNSIKLNSLKEITAENLSLQISEGS